MGFLQKIITKINGEKLITEVARGDVEKINAILSKKHTNPNYQNSLGDTALHYAKNSPSVRSLIKHGADINCVDNDHGTPLHSHILLGNKAVALFLIREGADLNIKNKDGDTPLHIAAGNPADKSPRKFVQELLENGADPMVKNNNKESPLLHGLLLYADYEVVKLLVDNGSNLNLRNKDGITPLIASIKDWIEQEDIVQLLLESGAKVNTKDAKGKSAIYYAKEYGYDETAEILWNYGASYKGNTKSQEDKLKDPPELIDAMARIRARAAADMNSKSDNPSKPANPNSLECDSHKIFWGGHRDIFRGEGYYLSSDFIRMSRAADKIAEYYEKNTGASRDSIKSGIGIRFGPKNWMVCDVCIAEFGGYVRDEAMRAAIKWWDNKSTSAYGDYSDWHSHEPSDNDFETIPEQEYSPLREMFIETDVDSDKYAPAGASEILPDFPLNPQNLCITGEPIKDEKLANISILGLCICQEFAAWRNRIGATEWPEYAENELTALINAYNNMQSNVSGGTQHSVNTERVCGLAHDYLEGIRNSQSLFSEFKAAQLTLLNFSIDFANTLGCGGALQASLDWYG